ncbi:unnamed protein product [Spirodela intermedia]|uniref:FCP1 homology domain-containing protein n=1 Tax=Spirodela intermedia TaxID=51605 RepID=A0A7I8ITH7_SPIIN|nr:unnamed protein product [Spirodela intermedia]CAA6661304.1 unnamed protein product [Spirodela intermedia]
MPARSMKSNVSKDCIRENKLHVYRKSTKVSQRLYSEDKASHLTACPAVDVSGEIIIPANVVEQEGLFYQSNDHVNVLLSVPDSTPTDGKRELQGWTQEYKGSISAAYPVINEMIFSPHLDHGEVQHTVIGHSIKDNEGGDLPYLVPDNSDDGCCTSSDYYRSCNIPDHCISDLNAPLSFYRSTELCDSVEDPRSDSDYLDYDIMFDVPERYMILPFVERKGKKIFYRAIHQMESSDEDTSHSQAIEDLSSFDPQLFLNNLPDVSEAVSSIWAMLLPKETRKRKTVTLVLDLDETLVHSTLEHCADADFTFPVFFNMKEHTVYVRRRPYLHEFLERVAQMFKIVIFTASQSIYAEQLLDMLDPDKRIISQRVYRESCIFSDGSYTKDLTILGVDLAKVVIIDNSPQVFRLQVNNGIPIESWFDDPSDCALISLLPFLETLVDVDDVRPIISERFNKE